LTLAALILLFGRWSYDDPYITFRYADNLLAGNGLVYNIGQRTLSTTAPFYALLLAGLGLVWRDLPVASNVLSALALVLSAAALGGIGWARAQKEVGLIAALLLCLSPQLLATFGAETCLYVALILAGFYAYDRSHLSLAAGALALAAITRPDGLIAAGSLGIYHLLRYRRIPWQPVVLYAGLVGIWYAGVTLYFGSPVPATLLVKQQQGQMAGSTRFGPGFLKLVREYGRQRLYWLHGVLALLGLGRVLARDRHWIPLLWWTALYFLAYTLLGVSRYFWYYAPLAPAFVVLVAEGMAALVGFFSGIILKRQGLASRFPVLAISSLLLIALTVPMTTKVLQMRQQLDPRFEVYRDVGQWLAVHTPPQASVTLLEVGVIGYYARRPMIDFAGLIQPDVARQLASSGTYQNSAAWVIQTYWPDYVVLHRWDFVGVVESDWFRAKYLPVRDFNEQEALWLTVYRRDGVQLSTP
jgi:hypothetical protein